MNNIALMGRLTRNPELKYTGSNIPVCTFSLAVDHSYIRQGEERKTDFFDVTCWRGTAEFVTRHFSKGLRVAVVGRMESREWTDREGGKRRSWEVQAGQVFFADSKGNRQAQPEDGGFEELPEDDDLPF